MASGAARLFAGEALQLPSGIVTAAYLARALSLDDYGRFLLAASLVTWADVALAGLFVAAITRLVAEAAEWQPVASRLLQTQALVAVAVAVACAAAGAPVARLLGEPVLAWALPLLALGVPLLALARGHRAVAAGRGLYAASARAVAARHVGRPLLIIAGVESGLGLAGALAGVVAACGLELAWARREVAPPLLLRVEHRIVGLWSYVGPLFFVSLALSVFERLDLLMLKGLGAPAAAIALYGSAQAFQAARGVAQLAASPPLVASLTRLFAQGQRDAGGHLAQDALRLALLPLPLAVALALCAPEVLQLIFGASYLGAAPLLARLGFGAVGLFALAVSGALLTAAAAPGTYLRLALPLPALAALLHGLCIPHWGAVGAATVTALLSLLAGVCAVAIAARRWGVAPPWGTLARAALVAVPVGLAALVPAPGGWVAVKLLAVTVLAAGLYRVLGEPLLAGLRPRPSAAGPG